MANGSCDSRPDRGGLPPGAQRVPQDGPVVERAGGSATKALRTEKADPSCKDLRTVLYALDPAMLELHSHTKQAVVDDLLDDQTLTLFGLHLPARLFRADNSAQQEGGSDCGAEVAE